MFIREMRVGTRKNIDLHFHPRGVWRPCLPPIECPSLTVSSVMQVLFADWLGNLSKWCKKERLNTTQFLCDSEIVKFTRAQDKIKLLFSHELHLLGNSGMLFHAQFWLFRYRCWLCRTLCCTASPLPASAVLLTSSPAECKVPRLTGISGFEFFLNITKL